MITLTQISGRYHVVLIHRVNTFEHFDMPILWLYGRGKPKAFNLLIDYFHDRRSRSLNWQRKAARSIGLFFDFSNSFEFDEKRSYRNRNSATMSAFFFALQRGTILANGSDPTELFWSPLSTNTTHDIARHLDMFTAYAASKVKEMNPNHPLTEIQETFTKHPTDAATMARFLITSKKISSRSFLSHLKNEVSGAGEQIRSARLNLGLDKMIHGCRTVKPMPLELAINMLNHGFVKDANATKLEHREDITGKMIFLLLFGAGLRRSEPLHMWFNDTTFPNLAEEQRCIPTLRHPAQAPTYIVGENMNRLQYLKEKGLSPRHLSSGKSMYVGWKNLPTDARTKSTEAFFIHLNFERLFESYYHYYLNYRRELVSLRVAQGGIDHPFLFVSNGFDGNAGNSYAGAPYSWGAFEGSFSRALNRVEKLTGLTIPRGKSHGTTPHGLRHAYAMILVELGAPPKAIQRALHHASILSQEVYTQPEWEAVSKALTEARSGTYPSSKGVLSQLSNPFDATEDLKNKWKF